MRIVFCFFIFGIVTLSCKSNYNKDVTNESEIALAQNDTVRIANPKTEYEIIIIEPGFNYWLQSTARPEGYYSQNYLENRNIVYVREWNLRVMQPQGFDPNLYELRIDYNRNTDYGYEVNYKLYNYFIYFQLKYKQQLGTRIPRI
ncbi:DUF6146 family protein [Ichthyenterobacterium sp. W332]|uniref:DUF6146 family protein n=1 Tax=Microcosmobacter mediterraneus TaxID=3075607 RepID=A0ABU2YMZ7_9FLAO|nr:DUF6146 family protein [Ichthyenterobacterium sp. W332]MDT0559535.1 DUF6146 family protein [Ichthyenterobacterium sp. W332]